MAATPHPTTPTRVTPDPVHAHAWARRLDAVRPVSPAAAVGVAAGDRLLVVVAHPDDETLALGGTLAELAATGVHVQVVSLTSGEAALDHVGEPVGDLAARRRAELHRAGAALGLAGCTALGLPDSRLADDPGRVEAAVRGAVETHRPDRVATLWHADPHPDHRAVSRAALAVCGPDRVAEFLLWTVHWTDPVDVPDDVAQVALGEAARRARRTALAGYRTQVEPLAPHLGPVLPPAVVAWPHECVVRR
ncbi:PIG-L family deacetylase [Nocardioides panacis]|uniref:PIG-L family deacetylase n=1 Tax=Nocardioides panacis TaxID=2849501 RepID=A0A975SYS9_9ACTN|nr:PIG-L family deacetylase [Nocardioides panacis]QWZ08277.1 PIG-L family deacetylase [Nocardioides panacis]